LRRLRELERQIRELKKEFAPPPSPPPDSTAALAGDLLWARLIIVLFHNRGWTGANDRLQEIVSVIGMPEFLESNWNTPGVAEAIYNQFQEKTKIALGALIARRGGTLESLYTEVPPEIKNEVGLPSEFVEFSRRAAALFGDEPSA
jgi:hypothetical protein